MDRINKPLGAIVPILMVIVSAVVGCYGDIEPGDVPGMYVANYREFTDTLFIEDDGWYIHLWARDDTTVFDTGLWEYGFVGGERVVDFKNFSFPPRKGLGTVSPPNFWPARMERSLLGEIRLIINSDLGLYYQQRESGPK